MIMNYELTKYKYKDIYDYIRTTQSNGTKSELSHASLNYL